MNTINPLPTYREHSLWRLQAEPWTIESIEDDGEQVSIRGWALAEPGSVGNAFLINGLEPQYVDYPGPRQGVQDFFWQRRGAQVCGFHVIGRSAYPNGLMTVRFTGGGEVGLDIGRQFSFVPNARTHVDVPDADRRFRVIGNRDLDGFLRLGATDAGRLQMAVEAYAGKPLVAFDSVLDWGVGCGRVARFLIPKVPKLYGCDIDDDNIAWCKGNLRGEFDACRVQPPLPYADGSFDLIYGISVFTHLRAELETSWLAELRRVLRPGGIIAMTVHGRTAIDFSGLPPAAYSALLDRVDAEGLVVAGANHQLDGFVEQPDEYVNVFHSSRHIERVWGQHFEGIRQIPGYIYTHDLVLAERRE